MVVAPGGMPFAVVGFTSADRVVADLMTDRDKLRRIVPTTTAE